MRKQEPSESRVLDHCHAEGADNVAHGADGKSSQKLKHIQFHTGKSNRGPVTVPSRTGMNRGRSTGKGKTRKRDQMIVLLSKPHGVRLSAIVERLGWQAHTVRAALSRLRGQGFEIATSRSPKTGETVYAIVSSPNAGSVQACDGATS